MSSRLPDRIGVRAVLYTHDFEPITVIELPPVVRDYLARFGMAQLEVLSMPPIEFNHPLEAVRCSVKTVRLIAEPVRRGSHGHLMLFTADEENALLLKSAFLPGQRHEVLSERADAFAQGFMKAIRAIGH